MRGAYLAVLLLAIGCLGLIDWRYRLAYFNNVARTIKVLATTVVFFIVWDVAGIGLNIFHIGQTKYLTGIGIGEFPLEELFFLILLNYNMLLAYRFFTERRKERS